jgi:hypothetical protein
LRREWGVVVLDGLPLLCQPRQGALTLFETFARSFGHRLGHFGLLCLDCLGLLAAPLLGRRQRRLELLSGALLVPLRADNRLAPLVGIERAMGHHALAAVFLELVVPAEGKATSFLRTARALNLEGPPDWSANIDEYLYGGDPSHAD